LFCRIFYAEPHRTVDVKTFYSLLRNNARGIHISPYLRAYCIQPFLYYLRHSILSCFVFKGLHLMHHIKQVCYSHWFPFPFSTNPQVTLDTAVLCTALYCASALSVPQMSHCRNTLYKIILIFNDHLCMKNFNFCNEKQITLIYLFSNNYTSVVKNVCYCFYDIIPVIIIVIVRAILE